MTVLAVMILLTMTVSCSSGPDVIFVREDLDVDGEPRAVLKIVEGATTDVAYFNGTDWVVAEGVDLPPGWLLVSPKLGPKKK